MLNNPNWDKLWKEKTSSLNEKHVVALRAIKEINKFENIRTIADFGCGNGVVLQELAREDKYKLFAYDSSNIGKKVFRDQGISFVQCNLLDLQKKDLKYDVAIITDVLEHFFSPQDVLKKLENCKYVVIVVPNFSELTLRMQVLTGAVPFQMRPKRGGHVYWFNIETFYSCVKKYKIIREMHTFPKKILQLKLLNRFPGLFANQFCAILKPRAK